MATNIDYTYHPPIDISVPPPIPSDGSAPPFREHLVQAPNEGQSRQPDDPHVERNTATRDNEPSDTSHDADRNSAPQDTQPSENSTGHNPNEKGTPDREANQEVDEGVVLESDGVVVQDEANEVVDVPIVEPSPDALSETEVEGKSGAIETVADGALTKVAAGNAEHHQQATVDSPSVDAPSAVNTKPANTTEVEQDPLNAPLKPQGEAGGAATADTAKDDAGDGNNDRRQSPNVELNSPKGEVKPEVARPTARQVTSSKVDEPVSPAATTVPAGDPRLPAEPASDNRRTGKQSKGKDVSVAGDSQRTGIVDGKSLPPIQHSTTPLAVEFASQQEAELLDVAKDQPTPQPAEASTGDGQSSTNSAHGLTSPSEKGEGPNDRLASVLSSSRGSDRSQTSLTETQQARLVQRVAKAFDIARARGESSVRLRLTPPQLGSLQIDLQVDSGTLTARLEVENQMAREALLDNLNTLRNRLAEQDIRVDQFDVDVRDQQSDQRWKDADREQQNRPEDNNDHPQDAPGQRGESSIGTTRVTTELLIEEGVIDVII